MAQFEKLWGDMTARPGMPVHRSAAGGTGKSQDQHNSTVG